MANQSHNSHWCSSPVTFLVTHRQPRGESCPPSPEESEYAPYSPEEGPFLANRTPKAPRGLRVLGELSRRRLLLGSRQPKVLGFGTLAHYCAGACGSRSC